MSFSFFSHAQMSSQPALEPYGEPQISLPQWQVYYNEIQTAYSDSARKFESENLHVFENENASITFAFTLAKHPAHPAWITRVLEIKNGQVEMTQIGYFGGNEEAFSKLYEDYLKVNETMRVSLSRDLKQALDKDGTAQPNLARGVETPVAASSTVTQASNGTTTATNTESAQTEKPTTRSDETVADKKDSDAENKKTALSKKPRIVVQAKAVDDAKPSASEASKPSKTSAYVPGKGRVVSSVGD